MGSPRINLLCSAACLFINSSQTRTFNSTKPARTSRQCLLIYKHQYVATWVWDFVFVSMWPISAVTALIYLQTGQMEKYMGCWTNRNGVERGGDDMLLLIWAIFFTAEKRKTRNHVQKLDCLNFKGQLLYVLSVAVKSTFDLWQFLCLQAESKVISTCSLAIIMPCYLILVTGAQQSTQDTRVICNI